MRSLKVAVLFVCVCLHLSCAHFIDIDPHTPEQVHISVGASPGTMTVMWVTANDTRDSTVLYGQGHQTNLKVTGSSIKFTHSGEEKRFQFIHTVTLQNLEPGTNYTYKVGSHASGAYSKAFHFRSWPAGSDWAPSVCVYGDLGSTNAKSVPRLTSDVTAGMYDAIVHVGDMAYDMYEDNGRVGDDFFNIIQPLAASVPYMTCPGNHESHDNFSEYRTRFQMPGDEGKRMYFSYNMGPVHFISANSEVWDSSEEPETEVMKMYRWLEADLKEANQPENREQRPWIVLFAHKPMYCSNYEAACRDNNPPIRVGYPAKNVPGIEDLMFRYGVDVIFEAHEHFYERLWPTYNNTVYNGSLSHPYTNPKAPVHIVTGAAGQREHEMQFVYQHPWSAYRTKDYGYTRVKVHNSSHLYMEQVSDDKGGQVVDKLWLIQDSHGPF